MKKEIEALLRSDDAVLRLNKFCELRRWKVYELGETEPKYDGLKVVFNINHAHDYSDDIYSRDWEGIVEEVKRAQEQAFLTACEKLNTQLASGYGIGKVYEL